MNRPTPPWPPPTAISSFAATRRFGVSLLVSERDSRFHRVSCLAQRRPTRYDPKNGDSNHEIQRNTRKDGLRSHLFNSFNPFNSFPVSCIWCISWFQLLFPG